MSYTNEEKEFFKFIRRSFFKKKDFKKKIKKDYEEENEKLTKEHILNNASEIIFYLVSNSTKLWNKIVKDIESNWVELYLTESIEDQKNFPKIYALFERLHKKNIDSKNPMQNTINVTNQLGELFSHLVFSNKQSAKSTAGAMLEHHIETLMDECKYKFDSQKSLVEGEVLDFVFPNIEFAKKNPELSLSVECQNTLKDRVRLTQGKLQHSLIKRYLFTVSGLNAATQSDHQDLTDNKIKELKSSGVTLVVFKKVKDDKFPNEQSVISYENFFSNVYPVALKNWEKKIIQ